MAEAPHILRVVVAGNEHAVECAKLSWAATSATIDRGGDALPVAELDLQLKDPVELGASDPTKILYPAVGLNGVEVQPAFFLQPPATDPTGAMVWEMVSSSITMWPPLPHVTSDVVLLTVEWFSSILIHDKCPQTGQSP